MSAVVFFLCFWVGKIYTRAYILEAFSPPFNSLLLPWSTRMSPMMSSSIYCHYDFKSCEEFVRDQVLSTRSKTLWSNLILMMAKQWQNIVPRWWATTLLAKVSTAAPSFFPTYLSPTSHWIMKQRPKNGSTPFPPVYLSVALTQFWPNINLSPLCHKVLLNDFVCSLLVFLSL